MECHKKLATEAKEVAEEKIASGHDVSGAMKLAVKARRLDPELKGIDQLISVLDVLLAAADTKDYSGKRDYYRILQVDPNAEDKVIKKQYRKIALNVHPDKNHSIGAEEAFKLVVEAFEVLSDKGKRAIYDQGVWHGLSNMSVVNIESLIRIIKKFKEEWEKRKMQMSDEDIEKVRTKYNRWKEESQKMMEGLEKKREEWQTEREELQREREESERKIERVEMKYNKWKEEWQKRTEVMQKRSEESKRDREECLKKMEELRKQRPENRDN